MTEPIPFPNRPVTPANLRARVDEVFTPSSPVTRRDLFAGRAAALQQLLSLVEQPGRHAVVFGERGTGKTSLATIVPQFVSDAIGGVHVAATSEDTFESLWRKVAEAVRATLRRAERGLASSAFPADSATSLALTDVAGHDAVVALLAGISAGAPTWIVFDDFDRVADAGTRTRMVELAEATLHAASNVTLVFAGSAPSAEALIGSSSALTPVRVPRLTSDESVEVVVRGLRQIGLEADDVVIERIATLGNGLPGALQALALESAGCAGAGPVQNEHLEHAVRSLLADAPAELGNAYEQATVRARRGIYPEILLACALSPRDAGGTFNVSDVCATVTRIVRREVRGLTNQVSALTEDGRGSVLDKTGAAKTARYRFVDTTLEPYILMRGLEAGWMTHTTPTWLPGLPEATTLPKAA